VVGASIREGISKKTGDFGGERWLIIRRLGTVHESPGNRKAADSSLKLGKTKLKEECSIK